MTKWLFLLLYLLVYSTSYAVSVPANIQAIDKELPSPKISLDSVCEADCLAAQSPSLEVQYGMLGNPATILNMGDWRLYDYPIIDPKELFTNLDAEMPVTMVQSAGNPYITASLFILICGLLILLVVLIKRIYAFHPIFSSI